MELQLRNNFDHVLEHQDQWRALVLETPGQPFFMLPEYQTSWWQHLGHGQLEVLEFWEGKQLVGLLPLYLDTIAVKGTPKKVYRIVGAVDESDYLDLILKPEFSTNIFQQLIEYFANNSWDEVWLESLSQSSATHTQLAAAVAKHGWQTESIEQTVAPVITLPTRYDDYFKSLDPKHQKTFKRLMLNLTADDEVSYRVLTSPQEVEPAMATFIALHKASGTDKASFWTPKRERFFTDVATRLAVQNVLKLYFLDVNGEPASTLLVFDWQNQFLLYNSGFDAYKYGYLRVSNAIVIYTLEEAIKLGRSRYDFMRGREPYKFDFGAVAEPVYDLQIIRSK